MTAQEIILKPILSEKTYKGIKADKSSHIAKRYVFVVHKDATKTDIKNAVEELFEVKVESVNTANYIGKLKTQGKHSGMTPNYKKAVVQLTGESKPIAFFESLS